MGTQKGFNMDISEYNWKILLLDGGLLTPMIFQPIIINSK